VVRLADQHSAVIIGTRRAQTHGKLDNTVGEAYVNNKIEIARVICEVAFRSAAIMLIRNTRRAD
jgi:hypothetical protein